MEQNISHLDYFDSSALVKRYLSEDGSVWVQERCNDPTRTIVTTEISRVEVAAAFAAKLRGDFITQSEYQQVRTKLRQDCQRQYLLIPVEAQRVDEAIELTARQKLRGYDAVHLACALHFNQILLQNGSSPLIFVAADIELLQAAQAEGLVTENPLSPSST
jgi:predicted nucleic acid-binding protein